MASLQDTPAANRVHIAFFGLRNAGKSTLVNEFTGQPLAIVSDTPGTTTDPVSKAMEILPLGPCLVTDTAGLDDEGELGELRVGKSLEVLAKTDIAVWVEGEAESAKSAGAQAAKARFLEASQRQKVTVIEHRRGEDVAALKQQIAAVKLEEQVPGLLEGLVAAGDRLICVCPIDESAPKGRLILPQVQVLRDCLDRHATASVCQPAELAALLREHRGRRLWVIADSQAFREVGEIVRQAGDAQVRLTSFSVLFARQKGDLGEFARGLAAIRSLKDGDRVLIAEGCTHHRQCNDIGAVKIPAALAKLSGARLEVALASGAGFLEGWEADRPPALIVHCGGCMLTRRAMLGRIAEARRLGVPIVNYGLVLAMAGGLDPREVMI